MSNFRHFVSSRILHPHPDRSCTTDLVAHIHVSAGGNQELNDFEKLLLEGDHQRTFAVLIWGRVGAHGRESMKEGASNEQCSPFRPGSCARFEHAGSGMYY